MYTEKREYEQFFFSEKCLSKLTQVVKPFIAPCLLCAPTLGAELEAQGNECRILDIDSRFSTLEGFKHFDINYPISLDENYDLLLCDPPFSVGVSQLFKTINLLKRKDTTVVISWYQSRLKQFLQAFSDIKPVGVRLEYRDEEIQFYHSSNSEKFGEVIVELYSNDPIRIKKLWDK